MPPVATFVSYRLGGADGVGVEARKWAWALQQLGYATRRVAGALEDERGPDDVELPWLALDALDALGAHDGIDGHDGIDPPASARAELQDALGRSDLVVVENVCSLPINVAAARAAAAVVADVDAHVLFHHHDLPWQRRAFRDFAEEFPPRVDDALHVTVNQRSRRELEARGYKGVAVLQNRFDLDAPPGSRERTRERFGFADDELVVLQPSRAIERKNVPGGVRFATALARVQSERAVRYWLSGPAEDGYAPTLQRVLERATVPVTLGRAPSAADAYAACDLVVLPSTWEGFGNATIESVVARRPLAVFAYPVLSEILATGLRFFSVDDPATVARFLREPDDVQARFHDVNLRRARLSYALSELPGDLERLFADHGWM